MDERMELLLSFSFEKLLSQLLTEKIQYVYLERLSLSDLAEQRLNQATLDYALQQIHCVPLRCILARDVLKAHNLFTTT